MARIYRQRGSVSKRDQSRALAFVALLAVSVGGYVYKQQHRHSDPALTTTIGSPRVVDGDTIEMSGTRIRLEAIDAPELHQSCHDANGRVWPCGSVAARELRTVINGREVRCEPSHLDQYRRVLAICYGPDGTDINAWMVRQGWALAFRNSTRYRSEQREAETAKRGLWAGTFTRPWEWRDSGED
jgi:endonuclease YncB( thermonuclease family)